MEYGLVVLWLGVFLALGLAALPVGAVLFERLPDRGAAMAVPLSLVLLSVPAYLVGHLAFGLPALLAGLVVLVGAAALARSRFDADPNWTAAGEAAGVFAAAFLLVVAIRSADPHVAPLPLSVGEKFLDYGLLRSLLRATTLPPEDMWFAGEPVQYYYGGQMVVALLVHLTGTGPAYAYNLGLAGFFGAYVVVGYGLASNVAAAHGGPRRLAGALGAVFVGLAGNLHTAVRVAGWLLPESVAVTVAESLNVPVEEVTWTPADFSYFSASRVISISEFPLFAWINGDLHAHMMSPPFLLLVAGLCLAYWSTPEDAVGRRRLLVFGAVPPVAGLLAVVNTWSFPSAVALTALTILFADADPGTLLPGRFRAADPEAVPDGGGGGDDGGGGHGSGASGHDGATAGAAESPDGRGERADGSGRVRTWESVSAGLRREFDRAVLTGVVAGGTLLAGLAWSLPFWLSTASSQPAGFHVRGTSLAALFVAQGGFLLAFVPYLWLHAADRVTDPARLSVPVLAGAVVALLQGYPAIALFGPVLVGAWLLLALRRGPGDVGYEGVLILAGAGLLLLVEFVNVDSTPNYPGQMAEWNTVFKAWAQVWALWAPAAGVVLARLLAPAKSGLPLAPGRRSTARLFVVGLVFSTLLYAGFALPTHFEGEGAGTLDGTAWVAEEHPHEAEAIAWLDEREGQPNMASAPACGCNALDRYYWANAPASLTGVPTLAGWGGPGGHEYIYRNKEVFDARVADVRVVFTGSTDEQSALFERYDVEYVYVGPNERELYGGEISVGEHPATTVAFENEAVVVYRVDHDEL